MALINQDTRDELTGMYSSPDRAYHNMGHVLALLTLLERYRTEFADPEAVEAAIWFHDAVYDSRAGDNELKSAELATKHLSASVAADRLAKIRAMIEATAGHCVPQLESPDDVADAEKFLDMDLSILAADEAQYLAYEAAVRSEYSWADDEKWRNGRADFLSSVLQRPRIFISELFRREFEERARQNMERSIARLRGHSSNAH